MSSITRRRRPDMSLRRAGGIRLKARPLETSDWIEKRVDPGLSASNIVAVRAPEKTISYVAVSQKAHPQLQAAASLRDVFTTERDRWRRETATLSLTHAKVLHPAYQHIIGLGADVVPLLLTELETDPDNWFWALAAITRENPLREGMTFQQAVEAWLDWGRTKGIIG